MHKSLAVPLVLLGLGAAAIPTADAGAVRISQIYSAGAGDSQIGSPYKADYVEVFNSSASPVDVGGWILAFDGGSTTSSYGCAGCNKVIPVLTTIAPCGYLLIQMSSPGLYGEVLPGPDVVLSSGRELDITGGLALVNGGSPSGICVSGPTLEDLVKWGPGNCYLGAPTTPSGYFQASLRRNGGMMDTSNNANDFEVGPATPRNSSSPRNPICLASPTEARSWGRLKSHYR